MDTDDDLRDAIEAGAALAVVRVRSAESAHTGTRSRTAVYEVNVEAWLAGALPPTVALKHFGPPLLAVGHLYAIAAVDSNRFHDAWELRFATEAEQGDARAALSSFRDRTNRVDSVR